MQAGVSFVVALLATVFLLNGTLVGSALAQSPQPTSSSAAVTINCLKQEIISDTQVLGVQFNITLKKSDQSQISLKSQRFQADEDGNPIEHANDKLSFSGQLNCSPVPNLKYDFNCEDKVTGSAKTEDGITKYVVTLIKDGVPQEYRFDVRQDCRIQ